MKIAKKKQIIRLREKMDFMARKMLDRALGVKGSKIFIDEDWEKDGEPHRVKVFIRYPVVCFREHSICENAGRLYISGSWDELEWRLN